MIRTHAPITTRTLRAAVAVLAFIIAAALVGVGWGWLGSGGLLWMGERMGGR